MGLSLEGVALDAQKIEMISQPVTDGTIKLAPIGPIVLLRHRQTVRRLSAYRKCYRSRY